MPHSAQAAAAACPGLSYGDEHWSPERLRQRAEEVARGLVAAGVGSGDVVALMLRDEPAFAIVLPACRHIGASLFLSDRKSDMVISGGVNSDPAGIEQCLAGLPGVADCAVCGMPDGEFGEALAAAVQRPPGVPLSKAQVRDVLKARLAGYEVPRVVSFHEQLPREDTGEVFKRQLRAPCWAQLQRHI